MKWLDKILSFSFPEHCFLCGGELKSFENLVCENCIGRLPKIKSYCKKCGNLLPEEIPLKEGSVCKECAGKKLYFDSVRPVFKYEAPISNWIIQAKYKGNFVMAKLLGKLTRRVIAPSLEALECDFVIPIPAHRRRLFFRGYNQAFLMAMGFDKEKLLPQALKKHRNTPSQVKLPREERLKNIKNSFEVLQKYKDFLKNKQVLLFDDVITTGATLNEAAKVLKKAGVKKIQALVIAKSTL